MTFGVIYMIITELHEYDQFSVMVFINAILQGTILTGFYHLFLLIRTNSYSLIHTFYSSNAGFIGVFSNNRIFLYDSH